jgi:hypothetical protein
MSFGDHFWSLTVYIGLELSIKRARASSPCGLRNETQIVNRVLRQEVPIVDYNDDVFNSWWVLLGSCSLHLLNLLAGVGHSVELLMHDHIYKSRAYLGWGLFSTTLVENWWVNEKKNSQHLFFNWGLIPPTPPKDFPRRGLRSCQGSSPGWLASTESTYQLTSFETWRSRHLGSFETWRKCFWSFLFPFFWLRTCTNQTNVCCFFSWLTLNMMTSFSSIEGSIWLDKGKLNSRLTLGAIISLSVPTKQDTQLVRCGQLENLRRLLVLDGEDRTNRSSTQLHLLCSSFPSSPGWVPFSGAI